MNIWQIMIQILDVLIVAFLIYRVLLLLKNTRAMYLLKGVLILLGVYFISGWAHLETIHWILDKSWSVILLAIAIIFQPELRTALEKLGRKGMRFKSGDPLNDAQLKFLGEIKRFVEIAQATKTGALLVFEGEVGLKEQTETGIELDAKVSYELLMSIFKDKAPLHDGAILIRGFRVMAAGCIMPLSAKEDLGQRPDTSPRRYRNQRNFRRFGFNRLGGERFPVYRAAGEIRLNQTEENLDDAFEAFYYQERVPVYRLLWNGRGRKDGKV